MSNIDWDFDLLQSLIEDRGDRVIWEMAIACPCRKEDATVSLNEKNENEATRIREIGCVQCHGDGFMYRNATVVQGLITQINAGNRQLIDVGLAMPSDCVFSPAVNLPEIINDMDKVTFTWTDVLNEGQIIQRNGANLGNARFIITGLSENEDRLWYNAQDGLWLEDENSVVYSFGIDYTIQENKIVWVGRKPKDGVFYTVRYSYFPEWIAYNSPLQRIDRGRNLQQRVLLRKKHVTFTKEFNRASPAQRQIDQLALTGKIKI